MSLSFLICTTPWGCGNDVRGRVLVTEGPPHMLILLPSSIPAVSPRPELIPAFFPVTPNAPLGPHSTVPRLLTQQSARQPAARAPLRGPGSKQTSKEETRTS